MTKINELRQLLENKNYYHVTMQDSLSAIRRTGLQPRVGVRSMQMDEKPSIFLFKTQEAVVDALMNWLGEELPDDKPIAILEIELPDDFPLEKGAGFEVQASTPIPARYITQVYSEEEFINL